MTEEIVQETNQPITQEDPRKVIRQQLKQLRYAYSKYKTTASSIEQIKLATKLITKIVYDLFEKAKNILDDEQQEKLIKMSLTKENFLEMYVKENKSASEMKQIFNITSYKVDALAKQWCPTKKKCGRKADQPIGILKSRNAFVELIIDCIIEVFKEVGII